MVVVSQSACSTASLRAWRKGWLGQGKPWPYIPYLESIAMVGSERVLRHLAGATNVLLRPVLEPLSVALSPELRSHRQLYAVSGLGGGADAR
jgi:hypothetical protein